MITFLATVDMGQREQSRADAYEITASSPWPDPGCLIAIPFK